MVLNDFCITPVAAAEVSATYGGQKIPCLLFYTKVMDVFGAVPLYCLLYTKECSIVLLWLLASFG